VLIVRTVSCKSNYYMITMALHVIWMKTYKYHTGKYMYLYLSLFFVVGKNKFKNLIWTSKFKFSFRGLQLHFCTYAISAYHH
jgi:hypothetical protein